MIEIADKQIRIDGQPRLVLAGEIHYFRLQQGEWADRIAKLKAAGGNTVASYIPWLWHELSDGSFDLNGRTRPERDLGAFIDLCRDHGLWFFARPGPFVMAELKNEGLPYRLYDQHPEIVPVGWDGKPAPTRTVDYLAPAYLAECRRWYAAVAETLVPRLHPNGGNTIGVQLDNEIGMLAWISNSPDLTHHVLADLWTWLEDRHGAEALARRYPPDRFGPITRAASLRAPDEDVALPLLRDLGHYMRDRFARYVAALREYAEEAGISGVPFVVNVHGTEHGRGWSFPIGISQLYPSYTQAPGYLSGSDHYLGNLTAGNAADLYLINAFMDAVHRPEQPLTSVEFESGDGDYSGTMDVRSDPSSADFKLRLCIAQGNRLINHYLFTGGVNPRLDAPIGDGNDRISFTGERHGVAAPVGPEGQPNTTLPRVARGNRTVMAVEGLLAQAREERDGVVFGFIPDYFMTESVYPGSGAMKEFVDALAVTRFGGPNQNLARALLHAGFRYGAVDLQEGTLVPGSPPVLALAAARFMDDAVQTKVADYLAAGGQLLLVGEVPVMDMEGRPCLILAERLGLASLGLRRSSTYYHLSVVPDGWAAPGAERRVGWAQALAGPEAAALLRIYGSGEACAYDLPVGAGRAIVVAADFPCDVAFFRTALERLGAVPGLAHGCPDDGILLTSSAVPGGGRFVHLMNLDGYAKPVRLSDGGRELFPGRVLSLAAKDAIMLPFEVAAGPATVRWSTAEIAAVADDLLTVRLTQDADTIVLDAARAVREDDAYTVERRDGTQVVTANRPALHREGADLLPIRFG